MFPPLKMEAPLDTHHPSDAAPHAGRVETLAVCWLCVMHVCETKEIFPAPSLNIQIQ